ncbi:EAL domain-containing protein [Brucella sp. 21LCYQ03]|nr:EAL domain-containing protein [Brucella sp. 21LCYQ03]
MIKTMSIAGITIGFVWVLIFLYIGQFWLVFFLLSLGVFAIFGIFLAKSGYYSSALIVNQLSILTFIVIYCIFYDFPTEKFSRTTHQYIPIIFIVGFVNYIRFKSNLQLFVMILSLILYTVFMVNFNIINKYDILPDYIRYSSEWINAILSVSLFSAAVFLLKNEFDEDGRIKKQLQSALVDDELELFYQPQVNSDGDIVGVEALLRWRHSERGYVAPNDFLPAAQRLGLMPRIGGWVLNECSKTLAEWQNRPGFQKLHISMNVTADHVLLDDFDQIIINTILAYDVNSTLLRLEITESAFINDFMKVETNLRKLRDNGFYISIDDFGTGYSSLSYIKRLPINQIKIDRSFVADVSSSFQGAALAKNIIKMGKDLGMDVLAEGIENEDQFEFMKVNGCNEFQGFYYGKPMNKNDFEALFSGQQGAT